MQAIKHMNPSIKHENNLAELLKSATLQIFNNNEIAQCIYTFINDEFEDIDDILDDLSNYNECAIIPLISTQIQNKGIEWNENDKQILYKILLNIYKYKITNIRTLCQKCAVLSTNSVISNYTSNDLIQIAFKIMNKLNTTLKNKISNEQITTLFTETDIDGNKLCQMKCIQFCQIAEKYQYKISTARKLFNEIQNYFETHPELSDFNESKTSASLQIGSECEFYSIIHNKWIHGKINIITGDNITIQSIQSNDNIIKLPKDSNQIREITSKSLHEKTATFIEKQINEFRLSNSWQIDGDELDLLLNENDIQLDLTYSMSDDKNNEDEKLEQVASFPVDHNENDEKDENENTLSDINEDSEDVLSGHDSDLDNAWGVASLQQYESGIESTMKQMKQMKHEDIKVWICDNCQHNNNIQDLYKNKYKCTHCQTKYDPKTSKVINIAPTKLDISSETQSIVNGNEQDNNKMTTAPKCRICKNNITFRTWLLNAQTCISCSNSLKNYDSSIEFKQLDRTISKYYLNVNEADYFDSNGIGKFLNFIKGEAFDEPGLIIQYELGTNCEAKDCMYTEFDPYFPFDIDVKNAMLNNNINPEEIIFYILQHCYYFKQPPTKQKILKYIETKFAKNSNTLLTEKKIDKITDKTDSENDEDEKRLEDIETNSGNDKVETNKDIKSVKSKTSTFDINIFAEYSNNCNGTNCDHLNRLMVCLKYYSLIDLANDKQERDKFAEFCNNVYSNLLEDYIHLMSFHSSNSQLEKMQTDLTAMHNLQICNIGSCKMTHRYLRERHDNSTTVNDDEYDANVKFYSQTLDTLHFYLFHLYDAGLRIKSNDNTIDDDSKWRDLSVSKQLQKIEANINRYKNLNLKLGLDIERYNHNNKFNLNIVHNNAAVDNTTFMDIMWGKLKDYGDENVIPYLQADEYDTDAILYDLSHDDLNIAHMLHSHKPIHWVKKEIQHRKVSAFSFFPGLKFYYWPYYKNQTKAVYEGIIQHETYLYPACQLYVPQYYSSMKHEILGSGFFTIKQWDNNIVFKANEYLSTTKVKCIHAKDIDKNIHFGIAENDGIHFNHIAALIAYLDFGDFCSHFSQSFRFITADDTIQLVKKRNSRYWHVSKYMKEAVICFGLTGMIEYDEYGDQQNDGWRGRFYCGLSVPLVVPLFSATFHIPTSTSVHIEVAIDFSTNIINEGAILQLSNEPHECWKTRFFDASWLSRYCHEDERLFFGSNFHIRVDSIRLRTTKQNFEVFYHSLYILDCMLNGIKLSKSMQITSTDKEILR
eukprot:359779_1